MQIAHGNLFYSEIVYSHFEITGLLQKRVKLNFLLVFSGNLQMFTNKGVEIKVKDILCF